MELSGFVERLRSGAPAKFPSDANSLDFARHLDSQDKLSHLRAEFVLPTKKSLKKKALDGSIREYAHTTTEALY
jgi:kynureninase